jgi:hypothetical protein
MNLAGWKFALAWLTLCASLTAVAEEPGISFSRGDWEITCDNTRTCQMAGYSSGNAGDGKRHSVWITRAAGPNAPLFLTLYIDGQSKGARDVQEKERDSPLTSAQIQALIAVASKDGVIAFKGDSQSFMFSAVGLSAVMLKMDEVQGRIGTPGALIEKGEKPEESVLPPLPAPSHPGGEGQRRAAGR